MGSGAALANDLLFAMRDASLFTKLFSNDMDVVVTEPVESDRDLCGSGRGGGVMAIAVERALRFCGGFSILGGTGGVASGGLSKLIELWVGDVPNECSVASSASSNTHRVPIGTSRSRSRTMV